ncbi:MAG: type II secretion system protein [Desulfobia sp.]
MNSEPGPKKGFTLIEVIVTMMIVTMAGLAVFTFLRGTVTRSGEAVSLVRDLAGLRKPMEEISAAYHDYLLRAGSSGNDTAWNACKGDFRNIKTDYEEEGGEITLEIEDVSDDFGASDFEMLKVTAGKGEQTLAAFFSE